jgi:hypothetical protein
MPLVCTRDRGHAGPHMGFDGQEQHQWKRDARQQQSVEAPRQSGGELGILQAMFPEHGSRIEVRLHNDVTHEGIFERAFVIDNQPVALHLTVLDDVLLIVPWLSVGSIMQLQEL